MNRRFSFSFLSIVLITTGVHAQDAQVIEVLQHQEPRLEVLRTVVPQCEESLSNSGTPVQIEIIEGPAPDDQYESELFIQLNAGSAPDIFEVRPSVAPDLVAAGYLLNLTDRVEAWDAWQNEFYDAIKEQAVNIGSGDVYFIPWLSSALSLFYRQDLLEEAGISTEAPQSWDELIARAQEIKEKTEADFALMFPAGLTWGAGTYGEGFQLLLMGSSTPQLFTEEGKTIARSPGLLETFQFYKTLVDEGLTPVEPLLAPQPWTIPKYEMFPDGELAITTSGTWAWKFDWGPSGQTPIENIDEKVGTWPIPQMGGGTFVAGEPWWSWAINADTENPDVAWEVAKCLSSAESAGRYAVQMGLVPSRRDAREAYPDYAEEQHLIQTENELVNAKSIVAEEGISAVVDAVGRATEGILLGNFDAEQALDQYDETVTNLLGEENVVELPME